MARRQILLSQEIASAINELGSGTLDLGMLKGVLMRLKTEAIGIENGQFAAESEAEATALKSRIADLAKELEQAQAENAQLEAMVEKATAEIERLREDEAQEKDEGDLPEKDALLLVWMNACGDACLDAVAGYLHTSEGTAEYYLTELENSGFAKIHRSRRGDTWCLTHKARKYLAQRGMLD